MSFDPPHDGEHPAKMTDAETASAAAPAHFRKTRRLILVAIFGTSFEWSGIATFPTTVGNVVLCPEHIKSPEVLQAESAPKNGRAAFLCTKFQ